MEQSKLKSILKRHQYKITPARLAILNILGLNHRPITAEAIYDKLAKKGFDRVTIYRNLNSFEKRGILRKVNLQRNSSYYELTDDHHHHIVCTECGRIEDFQYCLIEPIEKKVLTRSPYFKKINQHSLELFSVCKSCTKG